MWQLAQGQVTKVEPGDQAKSIFIEVGIQGPGDSGIGGTQAPKSVVGIEASVTENRTRGFHAAHRIRQLIQQRERGYSSLCLAFQHCHGLHGGDACPFTGVPQPVANGNPVGGKQEKVNPPTFEAGLSCRFHLQAECGVIERRQVYLLEFQVPLSELWCQFVAPASTILAPQPGGKNLNCALLAIAQVRVKQEQELEDDFGWRAACLLRRANWPSARVQATADESHIKMIEQQSVVPKSLTHAY